MHSSKEQITIGFVYFHSAEKDILFAVPMCMGTMYFGLCGMDAEQAYNLLRRNYK